MEIAARCREVLQVAVVTPLRRHGSEQGVVLSLAGDREQVEAQPETLFVGAIWQRGAHACEMCVDRGVVEFEVGIPQQADQVVFGWGHEGALQVDHDEACMLLARCISRGVGDVKSGFDEVKVGALQVPVGEPLWGFAHHSSNSLERIVDHLGLRGARPVIAPEAPSRKALRLVVKVRCAESPLEVRNPTARLDPLESWGQLACLGVVAFEFSIACRAGEIRERDLAQIFEELDSSRGIRGVALGHRKTAGFEQCADRFEGGLGEGVCGSPAWIVAGFDACDKRFRSRVVFNFSYFEPHS